MMQRILSRSLQSLTKRKALQELRHRKPFDAALGLMCFCSNDYLGLASHPDVKKAAINGIDRYGLGSTASQMVSGYREITAELESRLAAFLGQERALIFSSGYLANLGVIQALCQKEDVIFIDKLAHASLIDGALSSNAMIKRFQHNDMSHLAYQFEQAISPQQTYFIITESVFSMNGDEAPLAELSTFTNKIGGVLIVDESHGFGVMGNTGRGGLEKQAVNTDSTLITGSFGKSLGAAGGFVAGNQDLIEYLLQFSRTGIYTTAMPPAVIAGVSVSLSLIEKESWRREKLNELIHYFKEQASIKGLTLLASDTAIQPIIIGESERALFLERYCEERGIWARAIRPPTVPKGEARIRITLTVQHSIAEIDYLISVLSEGMLLC